MFSPLSGCQGQQQQAGHIHQAQPSELQLWDLFTSGHDKKSPEPHLLMGEFSLVPGNTQQHFLNKPAGKFHPFLLAGYSLISAIYSLCR